MRYYQNITNYLFISAISLQTEHISASCLPSLSTQLAVDSDCLTEQLPCLQWPKHSTSLKPPCLAVRFTEHKVEYAYSFRIRPVSTQQTTNTPNLLQLLITSLHHPPATNDEMSQSKCRSIRRSAIIYHCLVPCLVHLAGHVLHRLGIVSDRIHPQTICIASIIDCSQDACDCLAYQTQGRPVYQ